jgi:hypothetical protein
MIVLFIAVVQRGSSLLRTYTFLTQRIFWHRSMTGSQRGFATADMRTMRAPRSCSVFRSAHLLATAMRAKFALGITFRLQTSGGSPAAADRRSHACQMRSCQRNGGKIGYRQRFLTTTVSGKHQCQRNAKARFALEALDRYN